MRYAIVSDIHANLEALQAVMEVLKPFEPFTLLSLGDMVGGGANPAECVNLVGDKASLMLCGITDLIVAGRREPKNPSGEFAKMINWTRGQLTEEDRDLVGSLPSEYLDGPMDMIYSHGSPQNPDSFTPVTTDEMVIHLFGLRHERFIYSGNTHKPRITVFDLIRKTMGTVSKEGVCKIVYGQRYYINAGSVGNPKDGDQRACAVVVDTDKKFIKLLRVEYDWRRAETKMRRAGLPLPDGW